MTDAISIKSIETVLPAGYTARAAALSDLEAVVEVINAHYQSLIGEDDTTAESMQSQWDSPGFVMAHGTRVVVAPDGQVAAYAHFWDVPEPMVRIFAWLNIHPRYEADGAAMREYLLRWMMATAQTSLTRAPEGARVVLHAHTIRQDAAMLLAFESLGFTHIRSFFEMRIALDAPPAAPIWPDGLTIRTMVRGQDERAVLLAKDEGFRDHWGHVERPFEELYRQWIHHVEDASFDPSLCFLVMDGDEIAATCICAPHADYSPDFGWVESFTVLRPWRGRGVGLALLQHCFGEYYRRGLRQVALGVDAQNLTGALRLYEKAGMQPAFEFMNFEHEVRPGDDLMKQQ